MYNVHYILFLAIPYDPALQGHLISDLLGSWFDGVSEHLKPTDI